MLTGTVWNPALWPETDPCHTKFWPIDKFALDVGLESGIFDLTLSPYLPFVHFIYLFWVAYLRYHALDVDLMKVKDLGLMCIFCDLFLWIDTWKT